MELIENYVYAVGQELPSKGRTDIENEIRSAIQDALDEQSKVSGKPIDEEMTVEVLKSFGSPEKMAGSYREPRYLIGPRLYPTFILVLKIVLIVMVVGALIRFGIELSSTGRGLELIGQTLVGALGQLFSSLFTGVGNLVFIFAILERTLPKSAYTEEEFNPRKLEKKPQGDRINPVEIGIEIFVSAAFLIVFNFYPHLLASWIYSNGEWIRYPLFSPGFFTYVPWISLAWLMTVVKDILLFRSGTNTTPLRWFDVVLNTVTIAITGALLAGQNIIDTSAFAEIFKENAAIMVQLATTGFKSLLVVILILEVVELAKNIVHIFRKSVSNPVNLS